MRSFSDLFVVRQATNPWSRRLLWILPFAILLISYSLYAVERHKENPKEKMVPVAGQIWGAVVYSFSLPEDDFIDEEDMVRPIVADTIASLKILMPGFLLAVAVSLVIGLHVGSWPWASDMFDPLLKVFSYLPPITLVPLIYVMVGIGYSSQVLVMFLATGIPLTRALILRVEGVRDRQIWNAQTLGPSNMELIWLIIRREIEPGFLDDVRLNLGTAWIYLIVVELYFPTNVGLGYRIQISSKLFDTAQIIFYVGVIAVLAFLMDRSIILFNRWKNRWYYG